jgi:hypothetical protein
MLVGSIVCGLVVDCGCGGSATVPTQAATVTGVTVAGPATARVGLGVTFPYGIVATYSNGVSDSPTSGITWTTSDLQLATISGTGQVGNLTPIKPGTVTVTATYRGVRGSMSVVILAF